MNGSPKTKLAWGSALLAAAVIAGGILVGVSNRPAEAQSSRSRTQSNGETITYASYRINEVIPTDKDDAIMQVYAFPKAPVFVLRFEDDLMVWAREENGIRRLLSIPLKGETFRDIVFLEDNRTFIVQTRQRAMVFSVDTRIIRD